MRSTCSRPFSSLSVSALFAEGAAIGELNPWATDGFGGLAFSITAATPSLTLFLTFLARLILFSVFSFDGGGVAGVVVCGGVTAACMALIARFSSLMLGAPLPP